jgi:hypothetical protein
MNRRRPLPVLAGIAATIAGLWTMFALFSASQVYNVSRDTGISTNELWLFHTSYQLSSALLWATINPVVVYIAERLPLTGPFRWRNVVALLALTPLVAVFRAVLGSAVQRMADGGGTVQQYLDFAWLSIDIRFHRNIVLVVIIIGITNLVLAYRASATREEQALARTKAIADDKVQRLRAAMQPRFFFAALDAVKQLMGRPDAADRMLVQVSAVLRKVLEFEQRDDVALLEELALVDTCLELERIRTGGLFTFRIDIGEALLRARIPPLLLYGLIEAALVAEELERGHLEIRGWAEGRTVKLDVRNDDPRRAPNEMAVDAARARLQRAFAAEASVAIRSHAGGTSTTVTMPLRLSR